MNPFLEEGDTMSILKSALRTFVALIVLATLLVVFLFTGILAAIF